MDNETLKDIRVAILRYLYGNSTGAMRDAAILLKVSRAVPECDAPGMAAQLGILHRQNLIQKVEDPDMPAVCGWQITGTGIQHFERHHA